MFYGQQLIPPPNFCIWRDFTGKINLGEDGVWILWTWDKKAKIKYEVKINSMEVNGINTPLKMENMESQEFQPGKEMELNTP